MAVKIDDVAKLAGVSKTTVSRVLNDRGYISDKTRKKVHEAMNELHYSPNAVARQLFKKQTNIVGLIFPTVDNPFFAEMVAELEKQLFEKGFKVFICDSMNDPEKERAYLKELLANQVDGLIVGAHNYNIEEYKITNLPIVAIDRIMNSDIPVISSDNYKGGILATELLIKKGAKHIVLTDGPLNLKTPAHQRRKAYQRVMQEHGLKPHVEIIDFNWSVNKKIEKIKELLAEYPDIDGIFTTNDIDATLVWQIAKSKGINVPKDLKIVGYDHATATKLLLPELTSIEQPISEMANCAVETLMKRIKGEKVEKRIILPVKLWQGESA